MAGRPRIAVVCAQNGRNGGMVSVDMAAAAYFGSRDCDFRLFMPAPTRIASDFGPGPIGLLETPGQLDAFTDVAYWGDFLNNPVYGRWDFSKAMLSSGRFASRAEGLAHWRRLFLLDGRAGDGPRAAAIGGNFQHDFMRSDEDSADIERLLARFALVLPRDPFSLKNLSRFATFEQLPCIRQGLDCAFLLPPPAPAPAEDVFLWAFGRSGIDDPGPLVQAAARAAGLAAEGPLGWLDVPPKRSVETLAALRERIAGARFVLTDIYHLAVNAIAMEVPVILLARPQPVQTGTLGDYKKHALMDLLGLGDWLVTLPATGAAGVGPRIAALARGFAAGGPAAPGAFAAMRVLRDRLRHDLDRHFFPGRAVAEGAPAA